MNRLYRPRVARRRYSATRNVPMSIIRDCVDLNRVLRPCYEEDPLGVFMDVVEQTGSGKQNS